jgi:hypothetical protein
MLTASFAPHCNSEMWVRLVAVLMWTLIAEREGTPPPQSLGFICPNFEMPAASVGFRSGSSSLPRLI